MARTISGTTNTGITLTDQADNPVSVTGTIAESNGPEALYGPSGGTESWTIGNSGRITDSYSAGYGVVLGSVAPGSNTPVVSGVVSNAGGGVIAGGASGGGVAIVGPGSVTNAAYGSIAGGHNAVVMLAAPGTVTNFGSITGATGHGVYLGDGGTVTNSGSAASIAGGQYAVFAQTAPGTVINSGSMTGTTVAGAYLKAGGAVTNSGSAAVIAGGARGIHLGDGGGTVSNAGTIAATDTTGSSSWGVELSRGVVTNSMSGTISGHYDGVVFDQSGGAGTLTNDGNIVGTTNLGVYVGSGTGVITNSASGTITGGSWGVFLYDNANPGTIANYGTIVDTGTKPGTFSIGAYLKGGGTVTNAGASSLIQGVDAGVAIINARGSVDNSGTIIGNDAIVLDDAGQVINRGVVSGAASGTLTTGVYLRDFGGGSIENLAGGTISGYTGVYIHNLGTAGDTFTNAGTVQSTGAGDAFRINASGGSGTDRLIVDPGAVFVGGVDGGNGIVELASGSSAGALSGFGSSISNFSSLQFDPAARWTVAGDSSDTGLGTITIGGFDNTDTIDVTDFQAASAAFAENTLTLTSAGGDHTTLTMLGAFAPDAFRVSPDGGGGTSLALVACFLRGTRILTPAGEVAVETLAIGDSVTTASGATRPIRWIGRRSYHAGTFADDRDILPIRLAAGCLDEGVPKRDLCISSQHALLVDGMLVPAELLVNGSSIRCDEQAGRIDYYHLELDSHDAIVAEGAAAETYVDCGNRDMFHNAADFARRYPNDASPRWRFCAPRLAAASAELQPIRDRIGRRAGVLVRHGPAEALMGHIDWCTLRGIAGWAFDTAHPEQRVRLELLCDGQLLGHVMADRFRPDLLAAGYLGDGRCAFHVNCPIRLDPLVSHIVELRRAIDGAPVPGSPVTLPAVSHSDADCLAELNRHVAKLADAAADASELDALIASQMTQVELLLAARARLDGGTRADSPDLHDRWGGFVPVPTVQAALLPMRRRALFVDAELPAPGLTGGDNAVVAHMRSLQRLGFEVSCAAMHDLHDRHGRARSLTALGVKPLLAPWYGSVEEVLRRNAGTLDVVYLHRAVSGAAYGRLVRQFCPGALLVYSLADLHHLRLARQGEVQDRPELKRAAQYWQAEELAAAQRADVVITHSAVEATLLRRQLPHVAIAVVPWGVPARQSQRGFAERHGVMFVGNFGHDPNVDAVHWLAREIVSLVWRRDSGIGFRIVGNGMTDALRQLARPGLDLAGGVADLAMEFDRVRLTVAPLRYGAGLKAKVVESLAAGVPCIGTPAAFEGMELPPAFAACIAASADELAAMIVRCHNDPVLHADVAEAGRSFAAAEFSEARIDALMQRALAPVLANLGEAGKNPLGRAA
ncbi:MAG TPA: Hint domain-containing protein [Acetobacteraceae bacterium]